MNQFGGHWTEKKMEIVTSYAKAYLTIMKDQEWAKTIYFDGFAGSGSIEQDLIIEEMPRNTLFGDIIPEYLKPKTQQDRVMKGTAMRILDIIEPKPFDIYYFVEKNEKYCSELLHQIKINYPDKRNAHVVNKDCNEKLLSLANYLKQNKEFRTLAFIDPYGMSVEWSSIEALKGLGVDLWILVPTGVGPNRLLVNDGNIRENWLQKLEVFLGMERDEIKSLFYRKQPGYSNLFGENIFPQDLIKDEDTVNKLGKLYSKRLKEVFKYVSEPFVMRNSKNSIMYHFIDRKSVV